MRYSILLRAVFLLLAITKTCFLSAQNHPVLLISIDGLRPDAVIEAKAHGLRVPNLRQMLTDGSYASGVRGILPTITYPSHTSLITGVAPERHGIYSNATFDPLDRNNDGWYWYAEDVHAETLWTASHRAGLTVANVCWPVTVGAAIDYNLPQYWRSGTQDDDKILRAVSTSGLPELLTTQDGKRYPEGLFAGDGGDGARTEYAIRLLQLKRPGFMTVYLGGLDHAEHVHGVFSAEANAVLESIDLLIGRMREAAGRETVLAVVSDHGFANVSKSVNLKVKFREAGLIETDASGHPIAWEAAPWDSGAVAFIMVNPSARPGTKQKVQKLLETLAKDPESGIAGILDQEEIRREGGNPQAAFAIALKNGYCLGEKMAGPFITPAPVRGMHGFMPGNREMDSSFFIAGPGVPVAQCLGEIDMRDIAPTLAAILGVQLPSAEGRNLFVTPP